MPITDSNISMRQSQKLKHLNEPITKIQTFKYANRKKERSILISQSQKHRHLNMPITDTNISMSQSQQLHICMTRYYNTALQKHGKHDN